MHSITCPLAQQSSQQLQMPSLTIAQLVCEMTRGISVFISAMSSKADIDLTQLQLMKSSSRCSMITQADHLQILIVGMGLDMQCVVLLHFEFELQSAKQLHNTIHVAHLFVKLTFVGRLLLHLGLQCQLFKLVPHLCVAGLL